MELKPKPWFAHSKNAPGDFIVTWWVPVRNQRGTATLDPRSLRFLSELDARAAATNLANARYATIHHKRDNIATITRNA